VTATSAHAAPLALPVPEPSREESRRVLGRMLAFIGYPPEWLDALEERERAAGRIWRDRDDLLLTMRD
jgi:hypothetical protein